MALSIAQAFLHPEDDDGTAYSYLDCVAAGGNVPILVWNLPVLMMRL